MATPKLEVLATPKNGGKPFMASGRPRSGLLAGLLSKDLSDYDAILNGLRASGIRNYPTDVPTIVRKGVVREAVTIPDNAAGSFQALKPTTTTSPIVLNGGTAGDDAVKKQVAIVHRARFELTVTGETAAIVGSHRTLVALNLSYGSKFTGVKSRVMDINIQGPTYTQKEWTEFEDPACLFLQDDTLNFSWGQVDSVAAMTGVLELDCTIFPWDAPSARPLLGLLRGCNRGLVRMVAGNFGIDLETTAIVDHLGEIRSQIQASASLRNL